MTDCRVEAAQFTLKEDEEGNVYADVESVIIKTVHKNGDVSYHYQKVEEGEIK